MEFAQGTQPGGVPPSCHILGLGAGHTPANALVCTQLVRHPGHGAWSAAARDSGGATRSPTPTAIHTRPSTPSASKLHLLGAAVRWNFHSANRPQRRDDLQTLHRADADGSRSKQVGPARVNGGDDEALQMHKLDTIKSPRTGKDSLNLVDEDCLAGRLHQRWSPQPF